MEFTGISMTDTFISKVQKRIHMSLPGKAAQELMAPTVRFTGLKYPDPANSKRSGVLLLLYPDITGWSTVFIERTVYGPHGGQISLPGGKMEADDRDIQATALRETKEEIGVSPEQIEVLGELTSLYVPNSNFLVSPFVGFINEVPEMVKDDKEVASIIKIDVRELFDAKNKGTKSFSRSGYDIQAPYYRAREYIIWGATAMIMSEFENLLK